jgi:5-hydroxyisourate hydrolase-like protein (transthyretin family)
MQIVAAILVVLMLIAVAMGVITDCRKKLRCTDNDGRVEKYDCREEMIPTGDYFFTVENCEWRCVEVR